MRKESQVTGESTGDIWKCVVPPWISACPRGTETRKRVTYEAGSPLQPCVVAEASYHERESDLDRSTLRPSPVLLFDERITGHPRVIRMLWRLSLYNDGSRFKKSDLT